MNETTKSVLITIAIVVAILFLFPTFLMGGMFPFGGMMGGWGGMMGGRGTGFAGGLGWLFPLVFWGGIITAIVLLIRGAGATSKTSPPPSGETALDVLKKRYASSEITKEEFEEKKKDLL